MKPLLTIIALLAICLASCGVVPYVHVAVDYDPKQTFSHDTTTILLVNYFNPDSLNISNKKKLDVVKAGAYSAIAAAGYQLSALRGVKAINLADSANLVANTDSVKELAQKYRATYVLTLDKFTADIVLGNVDYSSTPATANYNTVVTTNFTLYEQNGLYFKKLTGRAEELQSSSDYAGWFVEMLFKPTVRHNGSSVNSSARNAAANALKNYLPFTEFHDRPLYTNTDELEASVELIRAGKFDKVFQLLNPLIENQDAKIASHAAYNLAVVYEAQGDIESALEVAKLSNKKLPNDFANAIIADLAKE